MDDVVIVVPKYSSISQDDPASAMRYRPGRTMIDLTLSSDTRSAALAAPPSLAESDPPSNEDLAQRWLRLDLARRQAPNPQSAPGPTLARGLSHRCAPGDITRQSHDKLKDGIQQTREHLMSVSHHLSNDLLKIERERHRIRDEGAQRKTDIERIRQTQHDYAAELAKIDSRRNHLVAETATLKQQEGHELAKQTELIGQMRAAEDEERLVTARMDGALQALHGITDTFFSPTTEPEANQELESEIDLYDDGAGSQDGEDDHDEDCGRGDWE